MDMIMIRQCALPAQTSTVRALWRFPPETIPIRHFQQPVEIGGDTFGYATLEGAGAWGLGELVATSVSGEGGLPAS